MFYWLESAEGSFSGPRKASEEEAGGKLLRIDLSAHWEERQKVVVIYFSLLGVATGNVSLPI